jgi:hypothetical protein
MKGADVLFVVRDFDLHLAGKTGDVVPAVVVYLFGVDDIFTGRLGVAGAINLAGCVFPDDAYLL